MGASREHRQRLYEQLVGQTIAGRFEITSLLGFGGMGAVYQALQRNMQRDVALKVIPSHDPTTTARFQREAVTISKLHHPNTVTVFDYGQTDQGLLFLAMEMLSGHTLSALIEDQGPLTPNRTVHIASQVCRSLREAHQSDIVHRDVKPDNIFLIEVDNDPDFVKVLDFGIAKIVRGEDEADLTGTGRIIGTPKYMSPEQILAEPVDDRSDIYSLACIVFEMLCGGPPFQDTSTTKLMLAHAHQTPPTFSERLTNEELARIPGPLEQVVRRALSKSPAQRQRSIDEFRIELEAALQATDDALRAATPNTAEPTRINPSLTDGTNNRAVTDSSDLLNQHSSQTLAKLNPPSRELDSPTAPIDERAQDRSKTAIYAIVAILAVIGGLSAYLALGSDTQNEGAVAEPSSSGHVEAEGVDEPAPPAEEDKPAPDEPTSVDVRVVTEPPGAQVYEQGRYLGKTPMTMGAEAGSTLTYSFELDDYAEHEASFVVEPGDSPVFSVTLDEKPDPKPAPGPKPKPSPETEGASGGDQPQSATTASKPDETAPAGEDDDGESTSDSPQINVERVDDDPTVPILD